MAIYIITGQNRLAFAVAVNNSGTAREFLRCDGKLSLFLYRFRPLSPLNHPNSELIGNSIDMAERVGFEPTVEFPQHSLSRRALSTAQTPLRVVA
jgi:hypothetical protein